jgi:uncharacterized membrane-anchored protein YjiN (DUF445 family)
VSGPAARSAARGVATEPARRRDLVRMKATATAFLVGAAAVYVLTWLGEDRGWVGFVRAAAEAGMVGGLADWFAVTALFRHPLGLPIPHTAIIPTRKDALGQSLSDFVGANFLSEQVVRDRLRRADVASRLGHWLADPDHADRVTEQVAALLRGAVGVLRDEDVQAVLEPVVRRRLAAFPVGPTLGRLLGEVGADGAHHRLVDLVAVAANDWLRANRATVVDVVARQAPTWSPEFIDRQVAGRVYAELLRVSTDVRADRSHPVRSALDRLLAGFAEKLRTDPATAQRAQEVLAALLDEPEVRRAFGDLLAAARRLVLEMVDDPDGELRRRLTTGLAEFGSRLSTDADLRAKVDRWVEDAAAYVVTHYRDELTRTITETVDRWDGEETARRVELQVGRDLQFIRINGTVVGALAGVLIHAAAVLAT